MQRKKRTWQIVGTTAVRNNVQTLVMLMCNTEHGTFGIEKGYGLDGRGVEVQVLLGARFSTLQNVLAHSEG
jgi:hypothetical protein